MVRLTIEIPDDVAGRLQVMAALSSHETLESFVQELLLAEAGVGLGAPSHLSFESQDDLEEMLLRRIEQPGPLIESTPELWDNLKKRVLGKSGRRRSQ